MHIFFIFRNTALKLCVFCWKITVILSTAFFPNFWYAARTWFRMRATKEHTHTHTHIRKKIIGTWMCVCVFASTLYIKFVIRAKKSVRIFIFRYFNFSANVKFINGRVFTWKKNEVYANENERKRQVERWKGERMGSRSRLKHKNVKLLRCYLNITMHMHCKRLHTQTERVYINRKLMTKTTTANSFYQPHYGTI